MAPKQQSKKSSTPASVEARGSAREQKNDERGSAREQKNDERGSAREQRNDERGSAREQKNDERYRLFVESAAQEGRVWALWRDGWALGRDGEGRTMFPFWPSREQAQACAKDAWADFTPEPIPAEDFLDQLLPQLARDRLQAGISPSPEQPALIPSIARLITELEGALERDDEE